MQDKLARLEEMAKTVLELTKYTGKVCQDCDETVGVLCQACALEYGSRRLAEEALSFARTIRVRNVS